MGAKDFDLYGVGGYGEGKIGFGSKLGILSVDFMNGVTNPKARMGQSPLAQGAVEKTATLMDAARERGLPVIHCTTAFQPDLSDMFALGYRTIVPRDCVFDQGSVAHEQNLRDIGMRYVDVESSEVVLQKIRSMKSAVGQGKSSKQSTISQEG